MTLVLTDIGVGTTEGDDTGGKARVGGLAINANFDASSNRYLEPRPRKPSAPRRSVT